MAFRILFLALGIFLSISSFSYSQIELPDVTSPIIQKLPVHVAELSNVGPADQAAQEFTQVLANDLLNAALFEVTTGTKVAGDMDSVGFQSYFDAGVDYLVTGQYQVSGGRIKFAVRLFNVRQEKAILGRSYEASPGKVREAAHRFADLVMKQITGKDGFFTSKIAYVQGARTKRNLFIADYDGYNIRQLTRHSSLVMSPHCSPSGDKIIFNSDNVWDQDLYVVTLGSSVKERRLTKAFKLEQSPSWSPSGRQIAFSANGDIFVSQANGKGAVNLTRSNAIDVSPTWSPDGGMIAFVSDRGGSPQIYVMTASGRGLRKITSGSQSTDPDWSPSKEVNRIAFVKLEGGANIYSISPDGTGQERLTSAGRNENPSWSPDGNYIAFSSTRGGSKDLYMMYLNGQNQRRLGKSGGKAFPTWCK